jgi:hypothetical protein
MSLFNPTIHLVSSGRLAVTNVITVCKAVGILFVCMASVICTTLRYGDQMGESNVRNTRCSQPIEQVLHSFLGVRNHPSMHWL